MTTVVQDTHKAAGNCGLTVTRTERLVMVILTLKFTGETLEEAIALEQALAREANAGFLQLKVQLAPPASESVPPTGAPMDVGLSVGRAVR